MIDIAKKIQGEFEAFNKKKQELIKQLREEFPALISPLLERSNKIQSITWVQYTPYFNDGDECVFSSYATSFDINQDLGEDFEYGEEEDDSKNFYHEKIYDYAVHKYVPNPNFDKHEHEVVESLKEVLSSIPDEFYKDLFGDHSKITIFRDGKIDIEEYSHD